MKGFIYPITAILWKDIQLELRTRDIVVSVLIFALLVIVVFNFALDPTPGMVASIAPGILWVAITFGGVLGMTRSFAIEKEHGNLQGLLLAPVGREVVFFGKMLGTFVFMIVVEVVVFPVFVVLFNLAPSILGLIPIALLSTLGIATVGTVFSAMAINTRSREVMLPLLFFPVVLPVIVGAIEASSIFIAGNETANLTRWISLLAVFDAIFLVTGPVMFCAMSEE